MGLVATWQGRRTIQLNDRSDSPLGCHDVLVEVRACGICGSDVHRYLEGVWVTPGMPLGHEFAGVVTQVGEEVTGLRPGDRVAVNPAVPCRECPACLEGSSNRCETRVMAQGGLGEHVLVPSAAAGEQLFVMPDTMSFEAGAFVEPLSVAVRAVRELRPDLAAPVAVLGLGTVGQCVLQVLRAYGARSLVAADLSASRREAATASGAAVLDAAKDLRGEIINRWGQTRSPYQVAGPLAAAFECSGAEPMVDLAVEMTRAGGGVAFLGLVRERPRVDLNAVVQKELRLRGSFAYTADDAREAFRLLSEGHVDVTGLVSHRFPLSAVGEAFETQRRADRSVKVLVVPDQHLAGTGSAGW